MYSFHSSFVTFPLVATQSITTAWHNQPSRVHRYVISSAQTRSGAVIPNSRLSRLSNSGWRCLLCSCMDHHRKVASNPIVVPPHHVQFRVSSIDPTPNWMLISIHISIDFWEMDLYAACVMQVNFLIAGTQKGGTTALRHYLLGHPEVCMISSAEGHFFDHEENVQTQSDDYSSYHRRFHPSGRQRAFGDNTPIYMYWYDAPRRIWEYNSGMKFIILLRNPVERAFSHWHMELTKKNDNVDFLTALQTERVRCQDALPFQHRYFSYTDRGFYTEQLRRIWHFFPREQTLILKSEELRERPHVALRQICSFLSLSQFPSVAPLIKRKQKYNMTLSMREKHFLKDLFQSEIRQLERLLDWDCTDWLQC